MEKTLQELAVFLEGKLETTTPQMVITGVNGLEEALASDISFAVPPHIEAAAASGAGALVLPLDAPFNGKPVIRVANPRLAFARLLDLFRRPEDVERVISPLASIAPTAQIGANVAVLPFAVVDSEAVIGDNTVIYPHAYIGRQAKIGEDCKIYPNVTIREGCELGNRVIIQSGAVW